MTTATGPVEQLQLWCHEAVRQFGADWPRIHGHIQKKLAELSDIERNYFEQNISLMLAPLDYEPH